MEMIPSSRSFVRSGSVGRLVGRSFGRLFVRSVRVGRSVGRSFVRPFVRLFVRSVVRPIFIKIIHRKIIQGKSSVNTVQYQLTSISSTQTKYKICLKLSIFYPLL